MSPQWRVVVTWTNSASFTVEAEDEDEARESALQQAYDEEPFADDYDIAWEPERIAESAS